MLGPLGLLLYSLLRLALTRRVSLYPLAQEAT